MDKPLHTHARVPVLDLLRLAAVVAVILYHYGFWGPISASGISQVALPALGRTVRISGRIGFLCHQRIRHCLLGKRDGPGSASSSRASVASIQHLFSACR